MPSFRHGPDTWHRGPLALMMLTRRCPPRTALLAIAALLAMLLIDPPAIADSESAATGTAAASPVGGAPFEGFGVSGAWWARDTGRLPDRVARIARLLFAPSGLHLSQYRYNIGGGGAVATAARYAPGYLRRSGAYDWAADPAGRDMLRRARRWACGTSSPSPTPPRRRSPQTAAAAAAAFARIAWRSTPHTLPGSSRTCPRTGRRSPWCRR